ncbi:hypothetical protein HG531_004071 [Fusarium graminearum]|nr:hypothetical protein HG531_004071 [Fusarium graminearum]
MRLFELTSNVLNQDLVEGAPQLLVEKSSIAGGTVSDKSTNSLEVIVVEPRVAGVLLHDVGDEDKMGQDIVQQRGGAILDDDQNSHNAAHQEFVLLQLSGTRLLLDELEEVGEKVLGEGLDVGAGKHGITSIILVRVQVLDQRSQSHLPLLLGQLTSESVEILDGIHLRDMLDTLSFKSLLELAEEVSGRSSSRVGIRAFEIPSDEFDRLILKQLNIRLAKRDVGVLCGGRNGSLLDEGLTILGEVLIELDSKKFENLANIGFNSIDYARFVVVVGFQQWIKSLEPTAQHILLIVVLGNLLVGFLGINTYHKKLKESLTKCLDDMVDLHVELICTEQGSPSGEDRVCNFENTNVDLGISGGKSADELLQNISAQKVNNCMDGTVTNLREGIPSSPEIRISDHTNSITKLGLNVGRRRNHEAN